MKIDFNKKYTTISAYCIITFTICLAILLIASRFDAVCVGLNNLFKVLAPIIWGIVIAFIVNPVQKFFERMFKNITEKKKPHPKMNRWLSVILTMLLTLAAISTLVAIILPQVIDSIMNIFESSSDYFKKLETWVYGLLDDYPQLNSIIEQQFDTIQEKLMQFVDGIVPKLGDMAIKIKDGAISILIGLKDFIIGFIVSIYLLVSKEKFLAQGKKFATAIFPARFNKSFFSICSSTNRTLSGFISGKIIDSIIIGIICFISLKIMGIDMYLLISFIIGITNIIPFFGPIFGAIPCGILLLMTNPKQVIPFIIFVIILQQFDGNILGPSILGESTGLPAFWVMFAIIVGGGLFGFAGMILSVPLFAVVYELVAQGTNNILRKKQLSPDTNDYYPVPSDIATKKSFSKIRNLNIKALYSKMKDKLTKVTVDKQDKNEIKDESAETSHTEEKCEVDFKK